MPSALYRLFACLPLPLMYALADLFFPIFYHVARYRRRLVRRNLVESLPEKSTKQIRKIERKFYRFFLDLLVESCRMSAMKPAEIGRRMHFEGLDAITQALGQGRSIAVYMGHVGNWEWVSSLPLILPEGAIAAQIYHRLRSPHMDRVIKSARERFGAQCVEMRQTARTLARWAEAGQPAIVGLIADQSPRKRQIEGYVPFLNHLAPIMEGTARLIERFGMEAWYLDLTRTGRGYYVARFVKMEGKELTREYYRLLERTILAAPELYLWSHNRFKYARAD